MLIWRCLPKPTTTSATASQHSRRSQLVNDGLPASRWSSGLLTTRSRHQLMNCDSIGVQSFSKMVMVVKQCDFVVISSFVWLWMASTDSMPYTLSFTSFYALARNRQRSRCFSVIRPSVEVAYSRYQLMGG